MPHNIFKQRIGRSTPSTHCCLVTSPVTAGKEVEHFTNPEINLLYPQLFTCSNMRCVVRFARSGERRDGIPSLMTGLN